MKPIRRKAIINWKTGRGDDGGLVNPKRGVLKRNHYSQGRTLRECVGTKPAELIAAALAASFAAALATVLGQMGFVLTRLAATATVTASPSAAGWAMTDFSLKVIARVPGATQENFIDAIVRAKTSSPISQWLRANISMNAKLEK